MSGKFDSAIKRSDDNRKTVYVFKIKKTVILTI